MANEPSTSGFSAVPVMRATPFSSPANSGFSCPASSSIGSRSRPRTDTCRLDSAGARSASVPTASTIWPVPSSKCTSRTRTSFGSSVTVGCRAASSTHVCSPIDRPAAVSAMRRSPGVERSAAPAAWTRRSPLDALTSKVARSFRVADAGVRRVEHRVADRTGRQHRMDVEAHLREVPAGQLDAERRRALEALRDAAGRDAGKARRAFGPQRGARPQQPAVDVDRARHLADLLAELRPAGCRGSCRPGRMARSRSARAAPTR